MKEIKISINFIVKTADCKMETIIAYYKKLSILILAEVAMQILREFAIQYMNEKTQPFVCGGCGDNSNFIFKTKCGKDTTITTIFGAIILGQIQVQCKSCGKKMVSLN